MTVGVLFVDDEEDIRASFGALFENSFPLYLAENGRAALEVLARQKEIGVVVTDIRMPEMDGLELFRQGGDLFPDLGFIVVSGHGEADDIIEALRLGARNFLRKPYDFEELRQAVAQETQRCEALREDRAEQERDKYVDRFLTSVTGLTYQLPSRMQLVNPVAFKIAQALASVGICDERERGNFALALIEIMVNAIEHGNLEIGGEEKIAMKSQNEASYYDDLVLREQLPKYRGREVKVTLEIERERAVVTVQDEGKGFDFANLPDPTNPENLFLPSGRGLLMASSFVDEISFLGNGNSVRLVKKRSSDPPRLRIQA